MTRYIPILTIVLLVLLNSCGKSVQNENLEMRKKIISIHDEVMPLMGKFKSLEKKAIQEIETLQEEDEPDTSRISELKALAVDLDAAYEGMFDWMHQYDALDGNKTPEEIKIYLDEQLIKVTEVNDQFKAVLAKANEIYPA